MWRVPPDGSDAPDLPRGSASRAVPPGAASRDDPHVDVRLVRSMDEFAACEAMSREIWGAAERNVVPRELLLTMQQNGGLVHGAFLSGGRLVGFCFGFLGLRDGQLRLCSHQLGVLPEFRGGGIGIALKQAQRDDGLRLGYDLVSWTFDPLEARNAYINLHRLGCIARVYDRDHYGAMEDDLNRGLPSDRFEAEWWLRRPKLSTRATEPRVILHVGADGGPVREPTEPSAQTTVLIGIPPDFQEVKRTSLELALRWRMESRAAFEAALAAGLIAVDFRRDGTYVMARASPDASGAARARRAFETSR
jgi:predicted GNAT superfamily acetyltransferase